MKKILLTVMAFAAIGFTSCGNKQQAPVQQAEPTEQAEHSFDVQGLIKELGDKLAAGDAAGLQAALEGVKAKVAELVAQNPELARQCVEKVQAFLSENAEKIKEVAGDNAALSAVVTSLTAAPAETLVDGLVGQLNAVGEAGQQAVDDAKAAGQQAVDDTKAAAQQKVDDAKAAAQQKAGEAVDEAAAKMKDAIGRLPR